MCTCARCVSERVRVRRTGVGQMRGGVVVNALIHSLPIQPSNARAHQASFLRRSYLVAASQPRQTPSTTPARTHSQQTCQIEHPNAYWRQHASETPTRDQTHKRFIQARTTLRSLFTLRREHLSEPTDCPSNHLWRHSSRETDWQSVHSKQAGVSARNGRCCGTPGGVYLSTAYQHYPGVFR